MCCLSTKFTHWSIIPNANLSILEIHKKEYLCIFTVKVKWMRAVFKFTHTLFLDILYYSHIVLLLKRSIMARQWHIKSVLFLFLKEKKLEFLGTFKIFIWDEQKSFIIILQICVCAFVYVCWGGVYSKTNHYKY